MAMSRGVEALRTLSNVPETWGYLQPFIQRREQGNAGRPAQLRLCSKEERSIPCLGEMLEPRGCSALPVGPGMLPLVPSQHFGGDATAAARRGDRRHFGCRSPPGLRSLSPWEEAAAAHRAQPAERGGDLPGWG